LQLVDIATSVSEADAAVYSPAVLRLRDQSWELSVGLLVGAYFGVRIGTSLTAQVVQRTFGIFRLVVGARLTLFA
jgi:uncharacterized membrane protein YfcA